MESLISSKTRRKLTKAQKYLFFDLGLRRLSAREGIIISEKNKGELFEQLIGLELIRLARQQIRRTKILFWRDSSGVEVDWVIQQEKQYIPIEVKWTNNPSLKDAKHLMTFLKEYHSQQNAYIICRISRKIKLAPRIYALPWQEVKSIID